MNKVNGAILLVAVAGAVAIGSYTATRQGRQCGCGGGCMWLRGAPQSAVDLEHRFNSDAATLDQMLRQEQVRLADLIENPGTTETAILTQGRIVSDAREQLMRRAGQHVISLRKELSPAQCRSLMQFSAEVVCGSGAGRQMRIRGDEGEGGRYRRRGGAGMGAGRGPGAGRAGGCGLTCRLQLTDAQSAAVAAKDPGYDTQIEALRNRMMEAREAFAEALQDDSAADEHLLDHLDGILRLHRELDQRVAEHIVVLRGELTPEQRQVLIGLCAAR